MDAGTSQWPAEGIERCGHRVCRQMIKILVQFDAAAVHYEVVDVCPKEPMT